MNQISERGGIYIYIYIYRTRHETAIVENWEASCRRHAERHANIAARFDRRIECDDDV